MNSEDRNKWTSVSKSKVDYRESVFGTGDAFALFISFVCREDENFRPLLEYQRNNFEYAHRGDKNYLNEEKNKLM